MRKWSGGEWREGGEVDRVEAERTQADDGNCKGWSLVGAGGDERAVLVNRALSRAVHASPEHPCPLF